MHLHDNNKALSKDFNTFLNGVFKNRASHGKSTKIELNSCSLLCTQHFIDFWT